MSKSISGKEWRLKEADSEKTFHLSSELGISSVVARLLVLRGVDDPAKAKGFLEPSLSDLIPPSAFNEMPLATERLFKALESGERILIHGDYDVDGIASSAMTAEYLRSRGFEVDIVLPSRFEAGYGISREKVEQAAKDGYKILLTVDCGVTADEEISFAKSLGVDVIVTDHHDPGSGRPEDAVAVLNPKLPDSGYPHEMLSGTGVAYKLIEALELFLREKGKPEMDLRQLHDIVALGTIADVVPLLKENRLLVRSGLEQLRVTQRPGLKALMEQARLIQDKISVRSVAFGMAPRINAAGRLGDPRVALELLMTKDPQDARELAGLLDESNQQRRQLEDSVRRDCNRMIDNDPAIAEAEFIVLAKEDWPKGVLGIVASRISETYYRPTVLLTIEGDEAEGSGRSIEGFDLLACLNECKDLLNSHGGHAAAAGVRLPKKNVRKFQEQVVKAAKEMIDRVDLVPMLQIDVELALEDINEGLLLEMASLEPFGEGNRAPVFMARNVNVEGCAQIFGNNHLKFVLGTPMCPLEAIAFSQGHWLDRLQGNKLDMAFTLRKSSFMGRERMEMLLKDVRIPTSDPVDPSPEGENDAQRRVIDWRGRSEKLDSLCDELQEGTDKFVFVIDAKDPFREHLIPRLKDTLACDELPETDCFGEACQVLHEGINTVLSPLWRNEGSVLSHPPEEHKPMKVFVLSFPAGDFAGTPKLLDGLADHQESLWVYLAFGQNEYERKKADVEGSYPDEEMLRKVYRHLRSMAVDNTVTLADAVSSWTEMGFDEITLHTGLNIFEEISLLEALDGGLSFSLLVAEEKRALTDSSTYRHAKEQREAFEKWARWILKAPAPEVARKL